MSWPGAPGGALLSFGSPKERRQRQRKLRRRLISRSDVMSEPKSDPLFADFPVFERAGAGGCATRPGRAHKTCPAAELKQCSPTSPAPTRSNTAANKGDWKTTSTATATPTSKPSTYHRVRLIWHRLMLRRFGLSGFPFICRRVAGFMAGAYGEYCSSSAVGHGVCAPPGRVYSPPARNSAARGLRQIQGGLFFGFFLLAKQKKETRRRAPPAYCPPPLPKRQRHAKG